MVEASGDVNYDACRPRRTSWPPRGTSNQASSACSTASAPARPSSIVDVDRAKAKTMGVALSDVFDTLQAYLGSYYVNDFNRFGRTWQVNVQADAPFRMNAETIKQLKVRNADGDMVPLGRGRRRCATPPGRCMVTRYNMFPAAAINGVAAARRSAPATPWRAWRS